MLVGSWWLFIVLFVGEVYIYRFIFRDLLSLSIPRPTGAPSRSRPFGKEELFLGVEAGAADVVSVRSLWGIASKLGSEVVFRGCQEVCDPDLGVVREVTFRR